MHTTDATGLLLRAANTEDIVVNNHLGEFDD